MDCLPGCQDVTTDLEGVVYLCLQASRSWFDGIVQANSLAWKVFPDFLGRMESRLSQALLVSEISFDIFLMVLC